MKITSVKKARGRRFGYPVLISIDFDDFTYSFTLKDVRAQKFPRTDFFKTLTAVRK